MSDPVMWAVEARNLPEHAANRIHTDEGAREAGFPAALVAGVTTYAYLTHPLAAAWGMDWVGGGGGEVKFLSPVFAGDDVQCTPRADGDSVVVEAICPAQGVHPRAVLRAIRDAGPAPTLRDGEPLPDRQFTLGGDDYDGPAMNGFGPDYGSRAGDALDLYEREGVAHPAVWPAIGNRIMATDLVKGSWIHTRSIIRHHAPGPAGAVVDVRAVVVRRFDSRAGKRAILDIEISHNGTVLTTLEHEAVIELP